MNEIDTVLERYTNPVTGRIHGATFVAVDRTGVSIGNDIYRKSFGFRNVDIRNSPRLTPDTVTWMASQTKLTTSVAVMQVIERGLVGLDDDIRDIVPSLKDLKVIIGFERGDGATRVEERDKVNLDKKWRETTAITRSRICVRPILEEVRIPITLRQLMTHSSGFCYDLRHPLLIQYSEWANRAENMFSGTIEGQLHPLVFQPGTSWEYGPGLDWAGQVVERLTGMDMDQYQQEHIWNKIGAENTTFFPAKRGISVADIHESAERVLGEGTQSLKVGKSPWKFECRDTLGGAGLYSTANDYSKLLGALLTGGGPLLKEASVDELFLAQLGPHSKAALRDFLISTSPERSKSWMWIESSEEWRDLMDIDHCLCGVINSQDVKGRRKKRTVNRDGLPNLAWFIDREGGVAATLFTQVMPTDDPHVRAMLLELEKALYKLLA